MKARKKGWSRNRALAAAALILGMVATFGSPTGGARVTLDTRELAAIVESEVDHVTVQELSDWIIQGATDFRLIDLRDPASYAEYHVPLAENVPLGQLPDYPIFRNEKIVLYSDGGIHSAQAWFLLKAQKFPGAYILLGGLDTWKDEILFPALPADANADEIAEFERTRFVSEFFGGSPRAGLETSANLPAMSLPKVEMPSQPVVRTGKRKKKKKGC